MSVKSSFYCVVDVTAVIETHDAEVREASGQNYNLVNVQAQGPGVVVLILTSCHSLTSPSPQSAISVAFEPSFARPSFNFDLKLRRDASVSTRPLGHCLISTLHSQRPNALSPDRIIRSKMHTPGVEGYLIPLSFVLNDFDIPPHLYLSIEFSRPHASQCPPGPRVLVQHTRASPARCFQRPPDLAGSPVERIHTDSVP